MERRVYKYLRIQKAIDFLKERRVTFVKLHTWSDPTEKAFSRATIITKDGHEVNPEILPLVYALCVTSNQASEAAWVVYQHIKKSADDDIIAKEKKGKGKKNTKEKESIVRGCVKFSIKFKEFLSQIEDWAKENGYMLYVSRIRYSDWQEMRTIQKLNSEFQRKVFVKDAPFIENYLRVLSLKRTPYEYENEIRLFLVKWPSLSGNVTDEINVAVNWEACLNRDVYYGDECDQSHIEKLIEACTTVKPNLQVKESTLNKRRKHLTIEMPYNHSEIIYESNETNIQL